MAFFNKKPQLTGSEMALLSLSHLATALKNGEISLERGRIFDDIYLHVDKPQGQTRFTYLMFSPTEKNKPIAKFSCISRGVHKNAILFDVDFAVAPEYQGRNFGSTIAYKASEEFKNGMKGKMTDGFWLEAIVDDDNTASKRISSKIIGGLEILETGKNKKVFNYRNHYQ